MSNRPFIAARLELFVDKRVEQLFRALGWRERVIGYTAYGDETFARILGRVVLSPRWSDTQLGKAAEEFLRRRGWRNFFTAACVHARYTIALGDAEVTGSTDRGGYIDHRVRGHRLSPGWQAGTVQTQTSASSPVTVQVVASDADFGIVSDIDDTILSTWLPRPFIAAWNTFMRTESARQAVPGMAAFYDDILARHPGAPVIYLSTGAWNTQAFLNRFLRRHRYPAGAMLLTDWGPTNTGLFRSGQQHKRNSLLQLSVDFPHIRWVLVGDDGQHDPEIYGEFASANPTRVAAIAIRQLSPTEQFLAHGTAEPLVVDDAFPEGIPIVRAPDGRGLRRVIREHLGLT
ncbi:MAG: App1 family protein [Actinomycetes bacterium]